MDTGKSYENGRVKEAQRGQNSEIMDIFKKISKDRRKAVIDFARSLETLQISKLPCVHQVQAGLK